MRQNQTPARTLAAGAKSKSEDSKVTFPHRLLQHLAANQAVVTDPLGLGHIAIAIGRVGRHADAPRWAACSLPRRERSRILARSYSAKIPCVCSVKGSSGLAGAYLAAASPVAEITAAWFSRHSAATLQRHRLEKPQDVLSNPMSGILGVALSINDRFAQPRYEAEAGEHIFTEKGITKACLVEVTTDTLTAYAPPEPIVQRKGLPAAPQRRSYNMDQGSAKDGVLDIDLHWSGRKFNDVIREALDLQLHKAARAQVEP